MSAVPIVVALDVTPTRVSQDMTLDIRGSVTNVGPSTLDTEAGASVLLVDEKPSDTWGWAIANGFRDPREFALPSREKVEFRRVFPASSILPQPGPYELVLVVRGVRSAPVSVERF